MKLNRVSTAALVGLVAIGAAAYLTPRWSGFGEASPVAGSVTGDPAKGGEASSGSVRPAAKAPGKGPPGGPPPVVVVTLNPVPVQEELPAVGSLRSNQSVIVRPEVSGRVAQIAFRDGEAVRRGQLLIALDAGVNEAEVAQARAELELAQSNLQRTRDLARKSFVSDSAQDQAASSVKVLEAKLRLAQARLEKMRIVAPFDGMLGIRSVSVGDFVREGTDLVNIEDVQRLKADFRLPERLFKQLVVGQSVDVLADALPGETFRGTIEAINPKIDSGGRSVEVRARLDNPGGRLRPGMFVRVNVVVGSRANALMVPEEAIVPFGDDFYVFRVVDSKAQRVAVKLGIRRNAQVELLSGAVAGDRIVVSGQLRLSGDGIVVRVVSAGPGSGEAPAANTKDAGAGGAGKDAAPPSKG
jgi:membrane fusion protein (multidrug efflux system)